MKTIAEAEEWYSRYIAVEQDKDILLQRAKRGYWGTYEYSRPAERIEDVFQYLVTDAEGNIMRSVTYDALDFDGLSPEKELFEWIFSQGKEKEWFISRTRTQVESRTIYDPDVMVSEVGKKLAHAEVLREQYISEIRRKHNHYERWREACKWAKENGVQYVSSRYNKYDTIKRNVIKAGLVDKWNELYPEFAIKGDY